MMTGHSAPKTFLLLGVAILLLWSCGKTAPTRFYLLHVMADAGNASRPAKENDIAVVISQVNMPEHLKRSQIVTRQSGHAVAVDEFNRWAEPLDASFTTILAEDLSLMLNSNRIFVLNRLKSIQYDYYLQVDILRFDGQIGEAADLICRWSLFREDEKTAAAVQRSHISRPVEGNDYQGLVAALSRMIADLSREIADRISEFERS